MNITWILSVFFFSAATNENQLIEQKTFSTIEMCIAAAQQVVVEKENNKDRDPLTHFTASCTPKNG